MTKSLLALSLGIAIAAFVLFTITRKSGSYALVDLVEAKAPDELRSFVTHASQHAEDMGGHLVLAHKMLPPVVIPDQRAADADRATNLLVITEYPTRAAGESAFAARASWDEQYDCRTYATRPMHSIKLRIIATVFSALEFFNRIEVADEDNQERIDALIETSHIVQGAGIYEVDWMNQLKLSHGKPIWMLNFLEYAEEANYREHPEATPGKPLSGAEAYEIYGNSIGPSLAGVGGRVDWRSSVLEPLPGTDDGQWHEISIATYPSVQALMTMYAQPAYRAAHVHRLAGLARTRLVATQPIQEHK